VDYVTAGGTLIVLPSRPGGSTLAEFLSPLGSEQFIPGTSTLHFTDGSNAMLVGGVYALTPPQKTGVAVTVFARDTRGHSIGARFQHGKGQVLFFGGDFSGWIFPPGTHLMEGGVIPGNTGDFRKTFKKTPVWRFRRLMKAAAIDKKVSVDSPPLRPRMRAKAGLYVSELVADSGSQSFEIGQTPRGRTVLSG